MSSSSHHHHHHHDHHNHHHAVGAQDSFTKALYWGIGLNLLFVVVEVVSGLWVNSVALLADAGHNFSDVLGLALAWLAAKLASRKPTGRFTYGLRRTSILAALANGILIMMAMVAIVVEAVDRLFHPKMVVGEVVMIVAGVGVVINGLTAWRLHRENQHDLNVHGAFLHMLTDMLVSVGVVVAGGLSWLTGWWWVDPMASLLIAALIAVGTVRLLREATTLILDGVPSGVPLAKVEALLANQPGVSAVHDLHIWALSTNDHALTGHLIMPDGHPGDAFLQQVQHALQEQFGIRHCTLQVEQSTCTIGCD